MNLKKILEDVKNNNLEIDAALEQLRDLPYENIGYANIDHHRKLRNGYPEVIYCEGKSDEHILGIIERMNEKRSNQILEKVSNMKKYNAETQRAQRIEAERRRKIMKK